MIHWFKMRGISMSDIPYACLMRNRYYSINSWLNKCVCKQVWLNVWVWTLNVWLNVWIYKLVWSTVWGLNTSGQLFVFQNMYDQLIVLKTRLVNCLHYKIRLVNCLHFKTRLVNYLCLKHVWSIVCV